MMERVLSVNRALGPGIVGLEPAVSTVDAKRPRAVPIPIVDPAPAVLMGNVPTVAIARVPTNVRPENVAWMEAVWRAIVAMTTTVLPDNVAMPRAALVERAHAPTAGSAARVSAASIRVV
jgi:hypothetical protein